MFYNVAQDSGMAMERFRVVFTQEMGLTFTEYMRGMRINGAKALLEGTRMRVSSVARAVGHLDVDTFQGLFIAMTGMEPREYRRRFGQKK